MTSSPPPMREWQQSTGLVVMDFHKWDRGFHAVSGSVTGRVAPAIMYLYNIGRHLTGLCTRFRIGVLPNCALSFRVVPL